jgi:hypothetical protein
MRRVVVATALVGLVTLLVTVPPASGAPDRARAGQQEARVDFNDDDFADLAVGAPGEDVGGVTSAGAVNVLYGSANGLEPSADVFFQGSGGVGGALEDDDRFGAAVAEGDFNGDGIFDLAVGVPGENIGPDEDAGAVNLLAGSTAGPSGGSLVLQGNPEDNDQFGAAIAGGFFLHDFDLNGFFDLAVGAPGETVGSGAVAAGAVSVFPAFGGGGGVVTPGPVFTQGSGGLGGTAETGDALGAALE